MSDPRSAAPAEAAIQDAVQALADAEKLIANIDRAGLVNKLDEFREFLDQLPKLQLDVRMARLRLQAQTGTDPDRTPVRGVSTADFRGIDTDSTRK